MAVADDRMDGVMDTADLSNIRDLVDEYYTKSYIRQSEQLLRPWLISEA